MGIDHQFKRDGDEEVVFAEDFDVVVGDRGDDIVVDLDVDGLINEDGPRLAVVKGGLPDFGTDIATEQEFHVDCGDVEGVILPALLHFNPTQNQQPV